MEMNEALITRVVERFAALADPVRVRMLMRLKDGEADVSTLAGVTGASQASVSKHLSVLRQSGWVTSRRVGTRVMCSVADAGLFDICHLVCDGVRRQVAAEHAVLGLSDS